MIDLYRNQCKGAVFLDISSFSFLIKNRELILIVFIMCYKWTLTFFSYFIIIKNYCLKSYAFIVFIANKKKIVVKY